MTQKPPPREQEQSIRARKAQMFEDDEQSSVPGAPARVSKPFAAHLRETPAKPMGNGIKAMLWVAGAVVLLLFAASVYRISSRPTSSSRPRIKSKSKPKVAIAAPFGDVHVRIAQRAGRVNDGALRMMDAC